MCGDDMLYAARNMQISEHKGQRKFEKSYLYDFADLLIVDEARQVLPEVAAASFALAKKALVIGDTEQIPPIWSIAPAIDVGNMLAEKFCLAVRKKRLPRNIRQSQTLVKVPHLAAL